MKHNLGVFVMPFMGRGRKNTIFWKMKINVKLPVVKIYAFESSKMSALISFNGNIIIYELDDKMCCISKLQIDCDFWSALYLGHEIQEYKT